MTDKQWLKQEQISTIIEILIRQCDRIEERNQKIGQEFPDLYDEQYYARRGHGDTGAVYAGFKESTVIPGMTIKKIEYGRGHWQPELHSETAVIQLYNVDAGKQLNSKEIREKCGRYNQPDSLKRYGVIQFSMSRKGHLIGAELVEFNENGKQTRRTVIYKYSGKLIPFVA